MKHLLCKLGFHKWIWKINDINTKTEKIGRMYDYCERCEKWGKLIYFKDHNNPNHPSNTV